MGFKEWAKNKVFYSTHADLIKKICQDCSVTEINSLFNENLSTINRVKLEYEKYEDWNCGYNQPVETRIEKQLEGWLYKEDYKKDIDKYQDPSLWNEIPLRFKGIKLKQK
jgi:hypothetical protein